MNLKVNGKSNAGTAKTSAVGTCKLTRRCLCVSTTVFLFVRDSLKLSRRLSSNMCDTSGVRTRHSVRSCIYYSTVCGYSGLVDVGLDTVIETFQWPTVISLSITELSIVK